LRHCGAACDGCFAYFARNIRKYRAHAGGVNQVSRVVGEESRAVVRTSMRPINGARSFK
jgi:hypothetical protein